jgi:hypothetical protein
VVADLNPYTQRDESGMQIICLFKYGLDLPISKLDRTIPVGLKIILHINMRVYNPIFIAMLANLASSLPNGTSICDYYTPVLLGANNASTQLTLLTLVVNTALIGNYTTPNVGITVTGILNPGVYNRNPVSLLKYFNGSLASNNFGGSTGATVNFLDDGSATPLLQNKPSNGNTTSNQYRLITRLYAYFGTLLGCSYINTPEFPAYSGVTSMYTVHKFMDISADEFGYFVTQVGLAAASFGVAPDDLGPVGEALNDLFGYRCSQPDSVLPNEAPELQAICTDDTCPLAPNATCLSYGTASPPLKANATTTVPCPSNLTASTSLPTAKISTNDAKGQGRTMAFEVLIAFAFFLLV